MDWFLFMKYTKIDNSDKPWYISCGPLLSDTPRSVAPENDGHQGRSLPQRRPKKMNWALRAMV